ncbi:MAG: ferredoxin [Nocardioides sp.]|uniref:ferredoxin n=1 Tax=Nocardioides sp. TaxID=35761 RepID=UPI0039E65AFD
MSDQHLAIDWTRCDGHGLCARLAADRVALDPWGFPVLDAPVDDADLPAARRLVAACPNLALRLERPPAGNRTA